MSEHNHSGHNHHHGDEDNLVMAFIINSVFVIIEIAGGILTNSSAILSDAVHDFGDSLSIGLAIILQKKSNKKSDTNFSYGYGGLKLVASLFSSTVILLGSLYILIESILKLNNPSEVKPAGMLGLACLGLLFNGYAMVKSSKGKSLISQVTSLHFLEDTLGWLAVLVGSLFILLFNWTWLDPVMAIMIAIYSLYNASRLLIKTGKVMIQSVPENVNLEQIGLTLKKIELVEDYHDLHVWSTDGEKNILTVHLVAALELDINQINEIRILAKKQLTDLNIDHATIEVESRNSDCIQANCTV